MEQSAEIGDLAKALSAFQADVQEPKRDGVNPHLKNRFVTLASAWSAIRPVIGKHGLSVTQLAGGDGQSVTVTTQLQHSSGQWIRESIALPTGSQKGLNDAQVMGSALSYLRRYALLAILGLSAEDDDAATSYEGDARNGQRTQKRDPLEAWRSRLAQCNDEASIYKWVVEAKKLPEQARSVLRQQLDAKCQALGTTLEALIAGAEAAQ